MVVKNDEGKSLLLANLLGSLVDLGLERSIRIGLCLIQEFASE